MLNAIAAAQRRSHTFILEVHRVTKDFGACQS